MIITGMRAVDHLIARGDEAIRSNASLAKTLYARARAGLEAVRSGRGFSVEVEPSAHLKQLLTLPAFAELVSLDPSNPASSGSTNELRAWQASAEHYRSKLAGLGIDLSTTEALRHVAAKWEDEPGYDASLAAEIQRIRVLEEQELTRRMGFDVSTGDALRQVKLLEARARQTRDEFAKGVAEYNALHPDRPPRDGRTSSYQAYCQAQTQDDRPAHVGFGEVADADPRDIAIAASKLIERERTRGIAVDLGDAVRRVMGR